MAGNSELFNYDKEIVQTIFSDLEELENYVNGNDDITLSSLYLSETGLAAPGSEIPLPSLFVELPLGIPAIIWGVVLGPVGVVLVYYLTDEDKEEAKKALYGCLAGGVLWAAVGILPGVIGSGTAGCSNGGCSNIIPN